MDKLLVIIISSDKQINIKLDSTKAQQHIVEGLRFYFKDNWYLSLEKGCLFKDGSKVKLLENRKYEIVDEEVFYHKDLYVYLDIENYETYEKFYTCGFVYANNKNAQIIANDKYLGSNFLAFKQGKILSSGFTVFRNGNKYRGEELSLYDEIEFLNFKFHYVGEFITINKVYKTCKLFEYKADNLNKRINFKLKERENKKLEKIDFIYPDLPERKDYQVTRQEDILRQIGPSITMSLAFCAVAGVNIYTALDNNNFSLQSISLIIFPIAMLISSLFWPFILRKRDKRKVKKANQLIDKEYDNDFESFLSKLKEVLDKQCEYELLKSFVDIEINKPFIREKEDLYFTLAQGKKFIPEKYKGVAEKERIEDLCFDYDFPYLITLEKEKPLSIFTNKKDQQYLLKRILLELISSYDPKDLLILIYDPYNISVEIDCVSHFYEGENYCYFNDEYELNNFLKKDIKREKIVISYDNLRQIDEETYYLFIDPKGDIKGEKIYFDNGYGKVLGKENYEFFLPIKQINFTNLIYKYHYYQDPSFFQKEEDLSFSSFFNKKLNELNKDDLLLLQLNGLRADFFYQDKQILPFDIHSSKDGPHGLIGGTTGSGKSELVLSMLLSLCLHNSPEKLGLIIIDYKGGILKEGLSYQGKYIPHIIDSLDNLQKEKNERFLISLKRECLKREKLFKELARLCGKPIMDLDDYRDNSPDSFGLPNKVHLVIAVDEFAQLKEENPKFLKELVSISRIGRSLGLHLLLATQKPSTCISEEILANSRFRIALRVADERESKEIISYKDAAYLKEAGSFYLWKDNEIIKAKSLYSGSLLENNIEVSLCNKQMKKVKTNVLNNENKLNQRQALCKLLIDSYRPVVNDFFFAPVVSRNINELLNEYPNSKGNIILGEYDDYENQKRGIVQVKRNESVIIANKNNNDVDLVLGECQRLKLALIYIGENKKETYSICESIAYKEEEKLNELFLKLMYTRRKRFVALVVEDLSMLLAYEDSYKDILSKIIRLASSKNISIYCFCKKVNLLPYKILSCFDKQFSLDALSEEEKRYFWLSSVADSPLCSIEGKVMSFAPVLKQVDKKEKIYDKYLLPVPEKRKALINEDGLLIGYDKLCKEAYFIKDKLLVIAEKEEYFKPYSPYKNHFEFKLVSELTQRILNDNFLWIGPGLFRQRSFYCSLHQDLNIDEALLKKEGKQVLLHGLNE